MSRPSPSQLERTSVQRCRARTLTIVLIASLTVLSATAPLATAAGETTLSIAPPDDSIGVGETTTVGVVVNDVDGGAGAAEFRVSLDDPNVARITEVTLRGSGQVKKTIADEGSWIDVEYAFADTADTGSVIIAEVTIEAVGPGTTDISLGPAQGNDGAVVYDEVGSGYSVTGTNGIRFSVQGDESVGDPAPGVGSSSGQSDPDGDSTDDIDGVDRTDGDDADRSGSPDSSSDASPSESGDVSNSGETSSGSESVSSSEVTASTPERASDTGESTTFGIRLDATVLDRAASAAGGTVGAAVVIVAVVLLGLGLYRRR